MEQLPRGTIKNKPEDFVVDEIPAYEPSGEGCHLYVHFRKTNLTTDDAVRAFAQALGVERRDVGVAGLKDKVGVTSQWISVPAADASLDDRVAALTLPGIEILEHRRHGNKLKTGHLRGNRFAIVVRDVDPAKLGEIAQRLDRIRDEGVPNAFGAQRFGREGDTHERARAWLTGRERPPRDPRLRRFQFSALQSAIFNAVLAARVDDGCWNRPLLGDLLKKEDTGGIFVCTDVQIDCERAIRGEVCPTGPIVGDRMRQPEADALLLEQRICAPFIEGIDLHRARSLGEGTRRQLRLRVAELSHSRVDSSVDETFSSDRDATGCAMSVQFVLPKGAYATTVLSNAFALLDAAREERQLTTMTEEE
ncbi:MAG TPA: tRNA pseudouridine(13) synthase TruD [Labilithrix sp.]|nr:tRNA pseudouridine(13) synthase TruD [Labilithrix sp.]